MALFQEISVFLMFNNNNITKTELLSPLHLRNTSLTFYMFRGVVIDLVSCHGDHIRWNKNSQVIWPTGRHRSPDSRLWSSNRNCNSVDTRPVRRTVCLFTTHPLRAYAGKFTKLNRRIADPTWKRSRKKMLKLTLLLWIHSVQFESIRHAWTIIIMSTP